MDIDQIRRTNEMTKALKEHGMQEESEVVKEPTKDPTVLLEREARKIYQKIDELHAKIQELESRMQQPQVTKKTEEQETTVEQPKKDQPRLRSDPDDYDEDAVSVDKIFYYGNTKS